MINFNLNMSVGEMAMWNSLTESINLAGGNIPWEGLGEMTVQELCETLGPNKIRFVYIQPEQTPQDMTGY